jgi:hypothetical protein
MQVVWITETEREADVGFSQKLSYHITVHILSKVIYNARRVNKKTLLIGLVRIKLVLPISNVAN